MLKNLFRVKIIKYLEIFKISIQPNLLVHGKYFQFIIHHIIDIFLLKPQIVIKFYLWLNELIQTLYFLSLNILLSF